MVNFEGSNQALRHGFLLPSVLHGEYETADQFECRFGYSYYMVWSVIYDLECQCIPIIIQSGRGKGRGIHRIAMFTFTLGFNLVVHLEGTEDVFTHIPEIFLLSEQIFRGAESVVFNSVELSLSVLIDT